MSCAIPPDYGETARRSGIKKIPLLTGIWHRRHKGADPMRTIFTTLLLFAFIVTFFRYAIFDGILVTTKEKQGETQTYLSDKNVSDGR